MSSADVSLDGQVKDELQNPGGWSNQIAVIAVGLIIRISNK